MHLEKQFLESILALTRSREPEVLSENLLTSLAGHVPISGIQKLQLLDESNLAKCEQTVALTISQSSSDRARGVIDEEPRRFRLASDVVQHIPSRQRFTLASDSGSSTYVPILNDSKPGSLIKIDTIDDISGKNEMIDAMVEIYTNILDVLEDGQRDKLTGLLNRRTFDSKLNRMMQLQRKSAALSARESPNRRSQIQTKTAWLAILDIDHFKRVNDNFGHVCGDEVIYSVAQHMRHVFRSSDLLFRFGGEEFVVVLEPMPSASAMIALERFRASIEAHVFEQVGNISVSIGYAGLVESENPPQVIDRADRALYYAKQHGRNQVASYEALVEVGQLEDKTLAMEAVNTA